MPYRRFEKVIKKNDDEIFQTGFIVISLCPFFRLFFNFIFNIENSIWLPPILVKYALGYEQNIRETIP